MIELYTAATGNGRRATLMLEECGIAYHAHKIEIGKGANKPAEFLKLNPEGTVPVIVDPDGPGGKPIVLNQSGAILLYLAEKTGKLVPRDPAARALTHQWMMLSLTDIAPASSGIFYATMILPEKPSVAASFFETRFLDLCRVVDRRLGAAAYLAGSELSIADVALYPVIAARQAVVEKAERLANLKRWAAALAARPTVGRALKVAA